MALQCDYKVLWVGGFKHEFYFPFHIWDQTSINIYIHDYLVGGFKHEFHFPFHKKGMSS